MVLPVSQAGMQMQCGQCNGQFQVPMPTGTINSPNPFADPVVPLAYGNPYVAAQLMPPDKRAFIDKKILAGIMGILLGGFGVHKYILGFNTAGTIMLCTSIAGIIGGCMMFPVLLAAAISMIGFVEGIIYLTKSDEEFYQLYAIQKKDWF
jgi:TM2 domain-containing membrane protein YozV